MKLLSLNLWNINYPLEKRMEIFKQFIKQVSPEIICLQEVSFINEKIQVQDILIEEGYSFVFHLEGTWQGRKEGLISASKLEILDNQYFHLPKNNSFEDMDRILSKITLQKDSNIIHVYNTHLSFHINSTECRKNQINYILSIINKTNSIEDFIVFCGDLNDTPNSAVFNQVMNNSPIKLFDSWAEASDVWTFSETNEYIDKKLWPNRRIDYIFSNYKFPLVSYRCMDQLDGFPPCSDHYGLVAKLTR